MSYPEQVRDFHLTRSIIPVRPKTTLTMKDRPKHNLTKIRPHTKTLQANVETNDDINLPPRCRAAISLTRRWSYAGRLGKTYLHFFTLGSTR